jgi:hypothetical protein
VAVVELLIGSSVIAWVLGSGFAVAYLIHLKLIRIPHETAMARNRLNWLDAVREDFGKLSQMASGPCSGYPDSI